MCLRHNLSDTSLIYLGQNLNEHLLDLLGRISMSSYSIHLGQNVNEYLKYIIHLGQIPSDRLLDLMGRISAGIDLMYILWHKLSKHLLGHNWIVSVHSPLGF